MTPYLEGIFDLARFWHRKKSDSPSPSPSAQPTTSIPSLARKGAVVFYDVNLNIVEGEQAVYELSFLSTFGLQWRLMSATRNTAPFSIWAYTVDWDEKQWEKYPANVVAELIPQLLHDTHSSCYAAFQWLHQDWASRICSFLSTHRGVLGDCERVFIWLAWEFVPSDQITMTDSWTIAVRQDDAQAINLALWSHVKRDCTLLVGGEPLQLSDEQLKLLRIAHCYFLPFYLENTRRCHPCTSQIWKDGAIQWRIDVPSPTQHERLEARLQLRAWLRGKVASDELAYLLR